MASTVLSSDYDPTFEPEKEQYLEYAHFLSLNPNTEPHLLWILREGLKAPLPQEWKPCETPTGDVYYFNFETGESLWDHPCDAQYKALYAKEKEKQKTPPNGWRPTGQIAKILQIMEIQWAPQQSSPSGEEPPPVIASKQALEPLKSITKSAGLQIQTPVLLSIPKKASTQEQVPQTRQLSSDSEDSVAASHNKAKGGMATKATAEEKNSLDIVDDEDSASSINEELLKPSTVQATVEVEKKSPTNVAISGQPSIIAKDNSSSIETKRDEHRERRVSTQKSASPPVLERQSAKSHAKSFSASLVKDLEDQESTLIETHKARMAKLRKEFAEEMEREREKFDHEKKRLIHAMKKQFKADVREFKTSLKCASCRHKDKEAHSRRASLGHDEVETDHGMAKSRSKSHTSVMNEERQNPSRKSSARRSLEMDDDSDGQSSSDKPQRSKHPSKAVRTERPASSSIEELVTSSLQTSLRSSRSPSPSDLLREHIKKEGQALQRAKEFLASQQNDIISRQKLLETTRSAWEHDLAAQNKRRSNPYGTNNTTFMAELAAEAKNYQASEKVVDRNLGNLKKIETDLGRSDNSLAETSLEADIASLSLLRHQKRWEDELQGIERHNLMKGLPHDTSISSRRYDLSRDYQRPTYDVPRSSRYSRSVYGTYLPSSHPPSTRTYAPHTSVVDDSFAAKELLRQHAKWLGNMQVQIAGGGRGRY